jgi:membrane protein implicated in regulation of membrane protease activity
MMTWWMWIVLGVTLAAIELATPGGFFVIFFGVSALVVGLLDVLDIADRDWVQWLLFTVLAIVALRLFRRPLLQRLQKRDASTAVDSLTRETAIATSDIAPLQHGRAELRGTVWSARNVGHASIASGQRCRVVAVQGLMLDIIGE